MLLFSGLNAETTLLAPLDLERVVVRGQARRLPVEILGRQTIKSPQAKAIERNQHQKHSAKSAPWRLNNRLGLKVGDRNFWQAQNSAHLSREQSSLGFTLGGGSDDGYQEGYGRRDFKSMLEFHHQDLRGINLRTRLGFAERNLELTRPSGYQGEERDEDQINLNVQLSTPWSTQRQSQFILDFNRAEQQADVDYRFEQFRLGFIHRETSTEFASSIEWDDKDGERTTLGRIFFKIKNHVLDPKTTIHLGVGAYGLASRKSQVDATGFITLDDEDNNSTFAFSPYLRLDHQLSQRLAFTASATQFYESLPIEKTFFNNSHMERPANIIEPSFNVQMDSGLRWDIGSDWKGSVSFQWNRYRDRPVTVVSTTSGRLTQTPWGKGEEQQWMLQLRGTPSGSSWYTDLTVLYRTSSWSDPNIDFTPFVPRTTIKLRGERRFGLWKTSLQFLHEGQRKAFPSEKTLDARNTFDADISWNPLASTELRLSIQNLLNQTSEWAPGLEHAPLRGVMELDFKF